MDDGRVPEDATPTGFPCEDRGCEIFRAIPETIPGAGRTCRDSPRYNQLLRNSVPRRRLIQSERVMERTHRKFNILFIDDTGDLDLRRADHENVHTFLR